MNKKVDLNPCQVLNYFGTSEKISKGIIFFAKFLIISIVLKISKIPGYLILRYDFGFQSSGGSDTEAEGESGVEGDDESDDHVQSVLLIESYF